ncbi:MAG TPA: T9SS type A sorting domain-containing protein, partial [Bacteroidia bacterium]|nr:T9SS type A sorting domain-containing protein [Bacteroidia bacterium]
VVTPTNGDNNIDNNTLHFCYPVINSHDPNNKEVYPGDVLPGYHDWFTYTIHFQNTGDAAARNIRLVDMLDENLDLSTFQLINYSHNNIVSFEKSELTFRFPNIMLADSTSDQEGSKGYVQYRIKPKAGLPAGTEIRNTANIYFDYNPAVVTNTTINNFTINTSIKENQSVTKITVYPNPGTGIYNISLPENSNRSLTTIKVYNVIGELVYETQTQNKTAQIDLSNQPKGVYVFRVDDGRQLFNQIVVKQ